MTSVAEAPPRGTLKDVVPAVLGIMKMKPCVHLTRIEYCGVTQNAERQVPRYT